MGDSSSCTGGRHPSRGSADPTRKPRQAALPPSTLHACPAASQTHRTEVSGNLGITGPHPLLPLSSISGKLTLWLLHCPPLNFFLLMTDRPSGTKKKDAMTPAVKLGRYASACVCDGRTPRPGLCPQPRPYGPGVELTHLQKGSVLITVRVLVPLVIRRGWEAQAPTHLLSCISVSIKSQ